MEPTIRTILTHANASSKLESPEEWRYDLSLWSLAVFLLLLALLIRFAWKPIMAGLENREKFIAGKLDEARQAEQGAAELQAYRDKLAAAAHEAAEIVNQARGMRRPWPRMSARKHSRTPPRSGPGHRGDPRRQERGAPRSRPQGRRYGGEPGRPDRPPRVAYRRSPGPDHRGAGAFSQQ